MRKKEVSTVWGSPLGILYLDVACSTGQLGYFSITTHVHQVSLMTGRGGTTAGSLHVLEDTALVLRLLRQQLHHLNKKESSTLASGDINASQQTYQRQPAEISMLARGEINASQTISMLVRGDINASQLRYQCLLTGISMLQLADISMLASIDINVSQRDIDASQPRYQRQPADISMLASRDINASQQRY